VIPTLSRLLYHTEPSVVQASLRSLAKFGPDAEGAVFRIVQIIEKEKKLRPLLREAISALGKIRSKLHVCIPVLLRLALNATRSDSDSEAISKAFDPEGATSSLPGETYRQARPRSRRGKRMHPFDDSSRVITITCEVLGTFTEKSRIIKPVLEKALNIENHGIRMTALKSLVNLGFQPARVIDTVLFNIETLVCEDNEAMQFRVRDMIEILQDYREHYPEIVYKLIGLPVLPHLGDEEKTPVLKKFVEHSSFKKEDLMRLKVFLHHHDPNIQMRAVEVASFRGQESASLVPEILKKLKSDNFDVAKSCLKALPKIGVSGKNVIQAITEFTGSEDTLTEIKSLAAEALYTLGQKPGLFSDGIDAEKTAVSYLKIDTSFSGSETCILGNKMIMATHKILSKAPPNHWVTDTDQFGALVIDLSKFSLETNTVPFEFPMQETGGCVTKRKFSMELVLKNEPLFSVRNPYYDNRSMGMDIYMFTFNPDTGQWRWLLQDENLNFTKHPVDAVEATKLHEKSINYGLFLIWMNRKGVFASVTDKSTAKQDEDDEIPESVRALKNGVEFRKKYLKPHFVISKLSDLLWVVDSRKYTSESEVDRNPPRYKIYGAKWLVIKRDIRFSNENVVECQPVNVIKFKTENKNLLIIQVRTTIDKLDENGNNMQLDSLLILDLKKAG
jgi:HEAT repeat protein